jgi:phage shock protein PspC (stress-responsive transcriptional regulator)
MTRRLERSREDSVIGGVAGGLAEYFDFPVMIIRLLFVILALTASGFFIYLVLWIVMPLQRPEFNFKNYKNMEEEKNKRESSGGNLIAGVTLISLGLIFLIDRYFPHIFFRDLWPFILIVIGIVIIIGGKRNN